MTRIIAGSAGGRVLEVPRGSATRPTSDRVREALFSRLDHLGVLPGARVLDLYAGSGALGLEAVSRGAVSALLVDSGPAAAAACARNAGRLGLPGVQVRRATAATVASGPPEAPVDLLLLDPPYDLPDPELARILGLLVANRWPTPGALVVVERGRRAPPPAWPDGLRALDERRYSDTVLWFAESGPPGPDARLPDPRTPTGRPDGRAPRPRRVLGERQ